MSVPGHLVADRYRLVSQVGTGGMGVVWEGWDERLHRRVAVKQLRLPPELTDQEREVASRRAMREARLNARLHHRYAVSVFDVVEDDGRPSLILQFIPSRTLAEVLTEQGPLPPAVVARMGAELASALSAAHELGIMHRDVKPANVLVADDGTAHISDFGISRALDDMSLTTTGMVHGTPAYLSPEVARGEQATFASDVFGLGATLFAALEGAPPFGTDTNPIALLHRVASGDFEPPRQGGPLTPLLVQLLSSDPAARPPMRTAASTLGELASSLQATEPAVADIAESEPAAAVGNEGTEELTAPLATPARSAAAVEPPESPPTTTASSAADQPPESPPTTTASSAAAVQPPETVPTTTAGAATPTGAVPVPPAAIDPSAADETPPLRRTWRRRRTGLVAVLVAALVVVGVGTAVLFRLLAGPDDGHLAGPAASATSTASAPATGSQPTSRRTATPGGGQPARTRSPSPTASPKPSPAPSPTPTPSPKQGPSTGENSPTAAQLRSAITNYYAQMPANTDGAWPLMTDTYKATHMHGRQGFELFWGSIDSVQADDVSATPPDRAEATLTYHFKDGRVVVERTSYELIEEGGALKIADSSVLTSSTR